MTEEVPRKPRHQMSTQEFEARPHDRPRRHERHSPSMDRHARDRDKRDRVQREINRQRRPRDVHRRIAEPHPLQSRQLPEQPAAVNGRIHPAQPLLNPHQQQERHQRDPRQRAGIHRSEAGPQ